MISSLSRKYFLLVLAFAVPTMALAHGVSAHDQEMLNSGGLLSYIYVGAKHMITGYDHLLFLAGVVFYLKGLRDIVRFVSVFTIGHSITLIGASYLGITADEHLVDAVIALSVLYKGAENMGWFKKAGIHLPDLLVMVFLFGLIHGFGLATRLQSFDIGTDQFLAKIVSFNVGVELGQIAALIPFVFILLFWTKRSSYPAFYRGANLILVSAGIGLFIYQLYGYINS